MRLLLVLLFALPVLSLPAVEPQPAGNGLSYVRLQRAGDALPPAEGPLVIDLRYYEEPAAGGDGAALASFLQAPGPLRVVLYDAAPPPAVVQALARRAPSVLTLAPAGAEPAADLAVDVSPADDRAAYAALEAGDSLEAVTAATVAKQRFDEAALIRVRAGQPVHADPPETETAAEAAEDAPAKPVDALLQRAVRVARGLQALGRA